MKVREFLEVFDSFNPIWINDNELTDNYLTAWYALDDAPEQQLNAEIKYITLDGDNILTLEI